MQSTYKEVYQYYTNDIIPKAKDNIYKHVGASLRKMKTSGFVQDTQEMSVDDLLKYLIIAHLIDNISMRDKIDLFLSLFNGEDTVLIDNDEHDIVSNVKKYFTTYMITTTNSINQSFSAFLFYDQVLKQTKTMVYFMLSMTINNGN